MRHSNIYRILLLGLLFIFPIVQVGFNEPLSSGPEPIDYASWKAERALLGEDGGGIARTLEPMEVSSGNGYVHVRMNQPDAEFLEGADPNGLSNYKRLMYSYPDYWGPISTSWILYKVDGFAADKTASGGALGNADLTYNDAGTLVAVWNDYHGVRIQQELSPVSLGASPGDNEQIRFRVKFTPVDGSCHDVGCIIHYDTMLDSDDGASISTAFGYSGVSEIFYAPSIPNIWRAYEGGYPPVPGNLQSLGILVGFEAVMPDIFYYGRWPVISGYGWAHASWEIGVGFGGDTAVLVKWLQHNVCPGDTLTYATYYGIGELASVLLSISHSPATIYSGCYSFAPNPITIDAIITNIGEDEANNTQAWIEFDRHVFSIATGDSLFNLGTLEDFGGSDTARWVLNIEPALEDTIICYTVAVTADDMDSAISEEYCIYIPPRNDFRISAAADDSAICSGECTRFRVDVDGGTEPFFFAWSPSLGILDTNNYEPFVCPEISGRDTLLTYRLIAYDTMNGEVDCIDTTYVDLRVLQVPTGTVNNDTIWYGEVGTLTVVPEPATGNRYEWSTWDTTQSIFDSPPVTSQYYVTIYHGICVSEAIAGTIFVLTDTLPPEGVLILPLPDSYSACSLQQIIAAFTDNWSLVTDSLILIINGDTIRGDSPYITWLGDSMADTMVFNPPPGYFSDGEVVEVFIQMFDFFGNPLNEPLIWSFIIDYSPPAVWGEIPPNISVVTEGAPSISVHIADSGSGLDLDNLAFVIEGITYPYGSTGIFYNPATGEFRFEPSALGLRFLDGDTIRVCLTGIRDLPDYCGPNTGDDYCWEFYIVLSAPYAVIQEPYNGTYSACNDQGVVVYIINDYDIDPASIRFSARGSTYEISDPELSFSDSLLTYQPLPGTWTHAETVLVSLDSADNIHGFHLTGAPVEWEFIIDLSGPLVTGIDPAPFSVVPDPSPLISMILSDDLSGLDESSINLTVNGISYSSSHFAVFWDGDSLAFDPVLLGISYGDGDTVRICLHAEDSPDYCDPNELDTCWYYIIGIEGPVMTILEPMNNTYSSCDDQAVLIALNDPDGVQASSIELIVQGIHYGVSDSRLRFRNDTLRFIPNPTWSNGDIIEVMLTVANDIYGSPLQNPTTWSFIIDLQPPVIQNTSPEYLIVNDPLIPISVEVYDSLSGLDPASIALIVNGLSYSSISAGITFDWDYSGAFPLLTVNFDPALAGVSFTHNETVYVCLQAGDDPHYCAPNENEICWEFFLDTRGPYSRLLTNIHGLFSACSLQGFSIAIWDTAIAHGVDTASIILNINGTDLSLGTHPDLTWSGDTLFFQPSVPWADGEIITAYLTAALDAYGNPLTTADTFSITMDLTPPVISAMAPGPGWVIEDTDPIISFIILDILSGVNYDGVIVEVNDTMYDLSNPEFSRAGSLFTFDVSISTTIDLTGGDTVTVCVFAADMPDTCSPNRMEYCWEFSLSRGGPVAHAVEPLESLYSACDSQSIIIDLADSNGIDEYTIELEINGVVYHIYNPELEYVGTSLIFTPIPLFPSGE
ncbi:hypothetical protein JW877_01350, partial [bacterium]|nr:hypothetical protein [bacterium]